jgi:hypothetical protein
MSSPTSTPSDQGASDGRVQQAVTLSSPVAQRLFKAGRVDFAPLPGQPPPSRLVVATLLSVAGSLGLDAALVALGEAVFPATSGFSHFRFYDYGTLTVVGVLAACAAWVAVGRVTSSPRWLFLRLAMLVTLALWAPDIWLLAKGEPPKGVGVLMLMHVVIAVVTYNALVRIAPVTTAGPASEPSPTASPVPVTRVHTTLVEKKWPWVAMLVAVCAEFLLGVAALFVVPFGRRSDLVPPKGVLVYLLHGVVGAAVVIGALALVVGWRSMARPHRISAAIGLTGVVLGGAGGLLSLLHPLRLLGAGVMLVGVLVAATGYLVGVIDVSGAPGQAARSES